jgi:hypothetical protein
VSSAAGPWPAGDSRPRSRRGPGVKPFTRDPSGPTERDPLATVTITAQKSCRSEGPDGSGRAAGLTLGGGSAQCAPPSPGRNHYHVHNQALVSRASRPPRSRSGAVASASRMQRRRVRAVSARLETVQKFLTARIAHSGAGPTVNVWTCSNSRANVT